MVAELIGMVFQVIEKILSVEEVDEWIGVIGVRIGLLDEEIGLLVGGLIEEIGWSVVEFVKLDYS